MALLAVVFLTVASVTMIVPASASETMPAYYEGAIPGPELGPRNMRINAIPEVVGPGHHSYYQVGDTAMMLAYDFYYGYYYFDMFVLSAISNNCEIWISTYTGWLPGDPRPAPVITQEMIDYILNQFETVIYPVDTSTFGVPNQLNGTNSALERWGTVPPGYYSGSSRTIILVTNFRDQNYYDPTYPLFWSGYFDTIVEYYLDRNVVTVNCYEWTHRLGPEGYEWVPGEYVTHLDAHWYEGVVAHEFQHLIHQDYNPFDDIFMNEGCADYAVILCGYANLWRDINSFLSTPDNSLTEWGDQGPINIRADYGAACLWTAYLADHYGGKNFMSHFVRAGIPGIEGINAALEYSGYNVTFDEIFRDWRIANLLHRDFPGCGKYNYKSIDLNSPDAKSVKTYEVAGNPVPWTKGTDFGNTTTMLNYDTGISKLATYGTDYIVLDDWTRLGVIRFDGDDYATYGWSFTETGYWASGTGDAYDASLVGQAYVNPSNPTLTLITQYDMYYGWNFGFAQVSSDNGETWTSLANEYTTSRHWTDTNPNIVANLPGLTGWVPNWEWTTMTFDLSAYSGASILIRFRYMTNYVYWQEYWNILSASVSDTALELTPVYPDVSFQVTAIYAYLACGNTVYLPVDMRLDHQTETGSMLALTRRPSYVILAISPIMEHGYTDYSFSVNTLSLCYGIR